MEAFLIYLFKSSIILSLFYLVYFFLLRKDTFFTFNRHFLLVGIISAILLPFIEFTTVQFIEQPIAEDYQFSSTIIQSSGIEIPKKTDWLSIGFYGYLFVFIILTCRLGIQLLSLRKVLSEVSKKSSEGFLLIETSKDIAPFSFFTYIIYNPALHHPNDLDMIIRHEKVHARQIHTLDLLLTHFVAIFQWVNPLIWLYKKELEQNLEYIADYESTQDLASKKAYQLAMVSISSSNYTTITNNFYQSLIKKRIVMLNKKQSNRKNLWKMTLVIPLLCLFLLSFNTRTEIKYIPNPDAEKTKVDHTLIKEEAISSINEEKSLIHKERKEPSTSKKKLAVKNVSPNKQNNKVVKEDQSMLAVHTDASHNIHDNKAKEESIKFTILKTTTLEDLEKIKRIFKNEYQVTISFSDISRNDENEITTISIVMNSEKSNANFSVENESPITPIIISYDYKNEKMGIGQSGSKNVWFKSRKGKKGATIFEIDSDDEDQDDHIFIQSNDEKTIFNFDNNSNADPLFIIDGKEASKKEVKKLKSKNIKTINVSKGDKAFEKYGKKAKDGVIDIITKKDTNKKTGFKVKKAKNKYPSSLSRKKDNVQLYTKDGVLFVDKNKIKPLILINGKKITEKELHTFKTNSMATIDVLKGEKAIAKYGDAAKNGVLAITTKK